MTIDFRLPPAGEKLEPRQRFVLWHVGWTEYEKIVEALNEQHVRVTYSRGDLELMSPLPVHELMKVWFRHFMLAMVEELDLACNGMGQTTLRRRDCNCGLEPDDCYYFASRRKVVDWATLNLDRDPPPDLVFELDLTRTCVDRLGVYAGLDVPEVWRFAGDRWHVHLLGVDGSYKESSVSALLPYLPISAIVPLLRQSLYTRDDRERIRKLRHWAREQVLPLRQAWEQTAANP
ncbi:MAG TPA: Uma2 family endonuclease [Gemmataceae bacterium]|nr:Uma2 family endonuclease [Gemmataceae bacterium]